MSEIDTSQTSSEKSGVESEPRQIYWRTRVKTACFRVLDDESASHKDLLHAVDSLLMLYGYGSRSSAGAKHSHRVKAKAKREEAASTARALKTEAKNKVTPRERLHNILTVETDAEV